MKAELNPKTGRLSVQTVERLHTVLAGDPRTEAMIIQFIQQRYNAASLLELPVKVANEVFRRPTDFIRAAKQHCEPELKF